MKLAGSNLDRSLVIEKIELLSRTLLQTKMETWNFGESVGFEGLVLASETLERPEYEYFLRGWLRGWAARREPFRRLDTTIPGHAAVKIALHFEDDFIMAALVETAQYLVSRPKLFGIYETWTSSPLLRPYGGMPLSPAHARLLANPPAGVFIDCLHFDPPFFAALSNAVQGKDLMDQAVSQALAYITRLQDKSGFFWHFALEGESENFGPSWGRGQGWALLGLLDVAQEIEDSKWREEYSGQLDLIRTSAAKLIEFMLSTQQEDGHWAARVDSAAPTAEASTAAFMYVGIGRAARMGIVNAASVSGSMLKSLNATVSSIDETGILITVSEAVMACTEPSHYDRVPTGFMVPWGQGPALMALCEAVKYE